MFPNHLRCTGGWNLHLIQQLFDPISVEAIQRIRLDHVNQEDMMIWTRAKNGRFSTKSAYQEICNHLPSTSANPSPNNGSWSRFWGMNYLIPKIQLFLWRLLHNGLGVDARIHGILEQIEATCVVCGAQEETIEHALLHCSHARACWMGSVLGMRTSDLHGDLRGITWNWIDSWDQQSLIIMANLLRSIWKHRWRHIKEGKELVPELTIAAASRMTMELLNLNIPIVQPHTAVASTPMATLGNDQAMENLVHVNVDGGIRDGMGAAAIVIRNTQGHFIRGRSIVESSLNVAYMEASAIRLGLIEAKNLGFNRVRILSDALGLVQALNKGNLNFPWHASPCSQKQYAARFPGTTQINHFDFS